jgi:LPS-assembly protein
VRIFLTRSFVFALIISLSSLPPGFVAAVAAEAPSPIQLPISEGSEQKNSGVANQKENPVHWSATKTLCDRKKNQCELSGNASLHQTGESLYADFISIDLESRVVSARGHVVFVGESALIQAEEMNYNLDTKTGSISKGQVSNNKFSLTGDRINKLGPGRFQTHRGEYSTCKDCPRSWSLLADDVDLEIEGYAYMDGVITKIGDAPALWLPYLIIPIKSKRQTGFLVPRFGFVPTLGFSFVQPFFLATSRGTDMTFGLGQSAGRGLRLEWEGRYRGKNGEAQVNYFHTKDKTFRGTLDGGGWGGNNRYSTDRWSLFILQRQKLPFNIEERFRMADLSDSYYPEIFPQDMGLGDSVGDLRWAAFLPTELTFSKSNSDFNSALLFRRYRNLMTQSDAGDPVQDPRVFDGATVQLLPSWSLNTYPKPLFGTDTYASAGLNIANFSRSESFFDVDLSDPDRNPVGGFVPGKDPVREGTRVSFQPEVSRSFRLLDTLEGTTKATYRQYFYRFGDAAVPSLTRSYLQLQLDLFAQLERTYELNNPEIPRMKHLVRPLLNYSLIPYRHTPSHPFTDQISYADGKNFTGYQFDNEDIIPLDSNFTNANYFAPQGNAISYGINSALIQKQVYSATSNRLTYDRAVDWNFGQSFNFREMSKNRENQRPLSRLFSNLNYGLSQFRGFVDYYYIPYMPFTPGKTSRHIVTTSFRYSLIRNSEERLSRLLDYDRSILLRYSHNRSTEGNQTESIEMRLAFSLNDYISPQVGSTYDLVTRKWQSVDSRLTFHSPSQCWMIGLSHQLRPYCPEAKNCSVFEFQWGINLDGNGYGALPAGMQ